MLGAVIAWASGIFKEHPVSKPNENTLCALVNLDDYTENQRVFLTANGTSIDVSTAAKHDYFSIVGVPAKSWTYSAEKPAVEPAGYRWVPLKAGFGLKVRI